MPPRAISLLCLVQTILLAVAWLLTASFVHIAEVSWGDGEFGLINYMPFFNWLRGYGDWGLLLLLVPISLAIVSAHLTSAHREMALVNSTGFRLCLVITLLSAAFAVFVVWHAFHFAFRPPPITTFRDAR